MKKLLFNQTCQFIALLLVFTTFGSDTWFEDTFKDLLFVTLTYLIFIIIGFLTYFRRPVFFSLDLNNSLDEKEKTTHLYIDRGKLETKQDQRKVNLTLTIGRRGSIWWKIMLHLLNKNSVYIDVVSTPSEIYLQPVDELLIKELNLKENGFRISLNDIIYDLSKSSNEYTLDRKYEFFIADHSDFHTPKNTTYIIEPTIILEKNTSVSLFRVSRFISNLLLDFKTYVHEVKLFRR